MVKYLSDKKLKKFYPDLKFISHFIRNISELKLKTLFLLCRTLLYLNPANETLYILLSKHCLLASEATSHTVSTGRPDKVLPHLFGCSAGAETPTSVFIHLHSTSLN